MKANRALLPTLILAAIFAIFLTASPAGALPQSCEIECTCSASCETWCSIGSFVTTCLDEGICKDLPICSGSCSCYNYYYGGSGGDTIHGSSNNDCIYGLGGDDTLFGEAGNDKIYGGYGNDTLFGGSGNDCLYGEVGADYLDGGSGHDDCFTGETYVSCND